MIIHRSVASNKVVVSTLIIVSAARHAIHESEEVRVVVAAEKYSGTETDLCQETCASAR